MAPNEINLLIDHLDKTLEGQQLHEVQELIRNDEEAAKEWRALQFTVTNLYEAGVYAQVTAVRNQYNAVQQPSKQQKSNRGIVRAMNQKMMRVAAVLVLVTFSAVAYKYISVNDASVYDKYYSSYELNTSRTLGSADALENAYRNKSWVDVITIANGVVDKNGKHLFLAGIAHLELKQYAQAINSFQAVKNKNQETADDYFADEAEYYLAMSYLANKEAGKAVPILEKIKHDKNHLFNPAVNKMGIDFKILQLKEHN